jgi:hypothetical protein
MRRQSHSAWRMPSWAAAGILTLLCVLTLLTLSSSAIAAAGEAPGWELTSRTYPTNILPGGRGTVDINVFNVGASGSEGPVTVSDTLPPGVTAKEAGELGLVENGVEPIIEHHEWDCTGNGPGGVVEGATAVTCTNDPTGLPSFAGGGGAPNPGEPGKQTPIGILVEAGGAASGLVNHATISGGGAPTSASTSTPITISTEKPPFGFVGWDGWFSNADGTLDTQAGSHPYEAVFSFDLASALQKNNALLPAGGEVRDIEVQFPPGLVGDPTAVPQCTRSQLENGACPQASLIGTQTVYLAGGLPPEIGFPVFNMVPPAGAPAEFGFSFSGILSFLDSTVRAGSDYGITTNIARVSQREVMHSVTTLWGFPGEASHDKWRNGHTGGCNQGETEERENLCGTPHFPILKPFLTLPTSCEKPEPFVIRANTWQDTNVTSEAKFLMHDANGNPTGFTGCEKLGFGPLITTSPDTSDSDSPAGLTVDVKPPIGGLQERGLLGTSDIQNTTVTLPEGFVINPGQAAGLQACQPGQDGLTTPAEAAAGQENAGPANCPLASKVGTVKIKTPLLEGSSEKEFEGGVFVMQSNPPELKLLVAASADGVNLKLVGIVHLDEHTGRLTTSFSGTPELPFTDFKLSFSGGAQAALDTPPLCGNYETTADFTPWSTPLVSDFLTSASFSITAGPGGGACPSSPMPFAPTLTAGSSTDQAGAFTNFSLLLQRGDGQQRIEKLQFKEPAGAAGLISAVPLCPEANATAGNCSAASHIGHAVVTSGPGPYPLVIPQPGAPEAPIYLTGPYKGAPFGLSIVTPVIAGPFNLGTIVTRAKIEVDPTTAQITITTDPLPQVVDGVPTDLRSVNSIIDRPGFLFNPTNCTPQQFAGTATSAGGAATAPISSPFGVGSCKSLTFKPKIAVQTAAKSSKAIGASLNFKISYPKGALGTQSWFKLAKFSFPKQLPARLTTIQKACLAATFEANPASCPPGSLIGHATVHTPVLPVPLSGPIYFVSHGGAKFPDAIFVLQGDNVTVDLRGETFINGKTGVTSATFANTPDVPFDSIEVSVPSGPTSEFAANLPAKAKGSFCGQNLVMPTQFIAQNGLEINQNTKIAISGCPKAKLTRAQKLAKAMKACKKKAKGKRAGCARQARKRYGGVKKAGKGKAKVGKR